MWCSPGRRSGIFQSRVPRPAPRAVDAGTPTYLIDSEATRRRGGTNIDDEKGTARIMRLTDALL